MSEALVLLRQWGQSWVKMPSRIRIVVAEKE